MAGEVQFQNVSDFFRQAVESEVRTFFENNAPGYNAFRKATPTEPITEKGYRIPYYSRRPGGHTAWIPSASDFNAAVPPQSQSMWVYPTGYALPIILPGTTIRAFQKGQAQAVLDLNRFLAMYTETATKRINQMFYGVGDGALAYSATAIGSTGVATMAGETTPSTGPSHTKGTTRLEEGHTYQAINTSSGAVRGTLTVVTPGRTSASVNVTSGTVSSGDPIVDVGAYQRWMRGMGWLVDNTTRDLQGLSTGSFPDLNASILDKINQPLVPADIETVKATLTTRNNASNAQNKLLAFMTFGQLSSLRKQGYNLRFYMNGEEPVKGVQKRYEDGDTVFIEDADMDEDRGYFVQADQFAMYEEMPFGPYDLDGQELRMLFGANSTGSDNYQKAIGCRANPAIKQPRSAAAFKRASLTGVVTQAGL